MTASTLTVASWNAERNGRLPRPGPGRYASHREVLAHYRPHIVLRQELLTRAPGDETDLWTEANALGLHGFMARTAEGRSKYATGVMTDPQLFETVRPSHHDLPWKPIAHVRVRRRGLPGILHLASAHLTHFCAGLRATEARRLTTLGERGRTALIGLDANSYPHRTDEETTTPLDWSTVDDPAHYWHRTLERAGQRVCDTRPSEILTAPAPCGRPVFTDLGHHAATELGQPDALKATASLRRTDQGPPQRVDWITSTPDLSHALLKFEVVDTADIAHWSDHALTLAHFDLDAVDRVLSTTHPLVEQGS
ncbi:endonuclease/exonuclease/phosphatase family protein [Streptomyces sp. NPDC048290]|uniref:endonuclease/exonuclease/phosphatase family protein n=1 Tax=Streptomyces sp. NPDC048290 TaxID=3155811 RepID=UPI003431737B